MPPPPPGTLLPWGAGQPSRVPSDGQRCSSRCLSVMCSSEGLFPMRLAASSTTEIISEEQHSCCLKGVV